MTQHSVQRQRNWAVYVLTALAVIAGILALIDAARYMGWLPVATLGALKFFVPNAPWFAALLAVVVAVIWFVVARWLWNLNPSGWLFVVVIAVLNLIFLLLAILGNTTFGAVALEVVVNVIALILALLPGTKQAFGQDAAQEQLPGEQAAAATRGVMADAGVAVAGAAVVAVATKDDAAEAESRAGAEEESAGDVTESTVEQVVNEINTTYSLDEIAKFKEKLEFVEGIGPVYAEKLRGAGVGTVLELLQRGATRKGRLELAETSGISGRLILEWVNHADLYRIKGVGSEYADLLEATGVDTVVELAKRNPANLLNAMLETNKAKQLVRREPVASQVEDWVAQAKGLPRVVQY